MPSVQLKTLNGTLFGHKRYFVIIFYHEYCYLVALSVTIKDGMYALGKLENRSSGTDATLISAYYGKDLTSIPTFYRLQKEVSSPSCINVLKLETVILFSILILRMDVHHMAIFYILFYTI